MNDTVNTPSRPSSSQGRRNGPKKKSRRKQSRKRTHSDIPFDDGGSLEVIPPEELEQSRDGMNLTELKTRPVADLVDLAVSMGLENQARSRKQDVIFAVLKAHAKNGENIYG
ncbi:MAG: Rho termination factor N-terminal domain-containing protein, partial [Pseudomonadota bacterium]